MKNYKQQPPYSIQIEPTEGCNLGCSFCGLQGMKKNGKTPWNFMTLETAENIAKKVAAAKWTAKIIFAMHGEPTLNKDLLKIIKIFRKNLPNNIFHIISNGAGFVKGNTTPLQYCEKLFNAGINHILLDNYSVDGDWKKIVDGVKDAYMIRYLGIDKTPMFRTDKVRDIIVLPSIQATKISFVRNLKNHCGAAFPLNDENNNKRCAVPFRELSFRYDGKVADVIEYGDYCTNIGEARDWLMNYCIDNKIQYVIQIDDNVVLAARAKRVMWILNINCLQSETTSHQMNR